MMSGEEKNFDDNPHEDAVLEQLGYQPELKRSFGLLGMIGFSFSIVTSWTALGGVLIVGVQSGGLWLCVPSTTIMTLLTGAYRPPGHDILMDRNLHCLSRCCIFNGRNV